jgi:hypothetical protein
MEFIFIITKLPKNIMDALVITGITHSIEVTDNAAIMVFTSITSIMRIGGSWTSWTPWKSLNMNLHSIVHDDAY